MQWRRLGQVGAGASRQCWATSMAMATMGGGGEEGGAVGGGAVGHRRLSGGTTVRRKEKEQCVRKKRREKREEVHARLCVTVVHATDLTHG
jgi:hypothetical protein